MGLGITVTMEDHCIGTSIRSQSSSHPFSHPWRLFSSVFGTAESRGIANTNWSWSNPGLNWSSDAEPTEPALILKQTHCAFPVVSHIQCVHVAKHSLLWAFALKCHLIAED